MRRVRENLQFVPLCLFAITALSSSRASATYLDDIGYTQLKAELGSSMPTGRTIPVGQVEHIEVATGGYAPDVTNSEFVGKMITLESGPSVPSRHATKVGQRFYGDTVGVAPGVTGVKVWEVDNWVAGNLRGNSTLAPVVEKNRVMNDSWKGTVGNAAENLDALRRFDYQIERDDVFAAVAMGNENTTTVPILLSSSYDAMSVGISSGTSNHGLTTFDGAGRQEPLIVAPEITTSLATPLVAGTAATLLQSIKNSSTLTASQKADAKHSETMKAVLMAGATKSQFPNWSRTTTQPLDPTFGSGQVNIERSYHIYAAGEKEPSTNDGLIGWDYNKTPSTSASREYQFTVPAKTTLSEMSIALTWNRVITNGSTTPGTFGNLQSFVANLDMTFDQIIGSSMTQLDESVSTVGNVEYLYLKNLPAGRYDFSITSNTPGTQYAVAWYGLTAPAAMAGVMAVPEPSAVVLALVGCGMLAVYGRRRRSGL